MILLHAFVPYTWWGTGVVVQWYMNPTLPSCVTKPELNDDVILVHS